MIARIILTGFLLFPVFLFSQTPDKASSSGDKDKESLTQSLYSNRISISNVYFNRVIEPSGLGEMLEVVFEIENNTDNPLELYAFVIASYEKAPKRQTSFDMPMTQKERVWSFVPFPDDITNFQYQREKVGDVDDGGKSNLVYLKAPKDPKKGINPTTGETYKVKDKLIVQTRHLSRYRKKYHFFNEAAILIFDKDGTPLFRQLYSLDGYRK